MSGRLCEALTRTAAVLPPLNLIKRLQLEKQFRELTETEVNPGKTYAESILKDIGKRALPTIGTGALLYGAVALSTRSFNPKDFAAAMFNGGAKKK